MKKGTYVYAVRYQDVYHVAVFSSLEKAQKWEDQDRSVKYNPDPFVWTHFLTDMWGVELWATTFKAADGSLKRIWITKYPIDVTPDEIWDKEAIKEYYSKNN